MDAPSNLMAASQLNNDFPCDATGKLLCSTMLSAIAAGANQTSAVRIQAVALLLRCQVCHVCITAGIC